MSSPHSERNSDGLVVYKKMKNVTRELGDARRRAARQAPPGAGGAATPPPAGAKPSPEDLVKGKKKHG